MLTQLTSKLEYGSTTLYRSLVVLIRALQFYLLLVYRGWAFLGPEQLSNQIG